MNIWMGFAIGLMLAIAGWLAPRAIARTRWNWSPLLLLDAAMPLALFSFIATAVARPIFAGIITCAIGAAYAYADRAKRKVLAEPIVFTDVFQAFDIFRHPGLALPFPHKGRIAVGVLLGLMFFVVLFRAEPAAWLWSAWPPIMDLGAIALAIWSLGGPLNHMAGRYLRRFPYIEDPYRDAAMFGPLATLLTYGILARAERPIHQARASINPLQPVKRSARISPKIPVTVIQCESFFDARRLHPDLARLPLATLDRCRATGTQWGRLSVPSWGANTVRTEFAVLTGLRQQALGLDRFNPYNRFADQPISSLAWRLRAQGYRTVCLHPFDRSFYGRNRVMPNLGFDVFIGEEAFTGAQRVNGYVADVEAARIACDILHEERGRVFLFVITMENHGPWAPMPAESASLLPASLNLPIGERSMLERYLQSIGNADLMLRQLAEKMEAGGVLAFYGDHLPSFPASFSRLGLHDTRSDYLVWRGGSPDKVSGAPNKRSLDISAHELSAVILQALKPIESEGGMARKVARRSISTSGLKR
jgi:hypothetical protein